MTPTTIKDPSELRSLTVPKLVEFAGLVREFLLDTVSKTGGHIGANLGTIELTLALHYCFDTPTDALIFDTGHQGYTHKIVTGRASEFSSLNTFGGMSRFLARSESPYDTIDASHAGTALSLGIGMARARRLMGEPGKVVCVVGDGSLVEGMSQEALNDLVDEPNLVVVVNHNGYAISPSSGRMKAHLDESPSVDGHDLAALVRAFRGVRKHFCVRTVKGNGWEPADRHPYRAHFLFPFDRETGEVKESQKPSYAKVVADALDGLMAADERIVAITPSTLYAVGMEELFKKYPTRCFDPGMAEQHAMGLAAGMALQGLRPVIAYQSTFCQRAFDQLFHDVCAQNLPVTLLLYRSGLAGYDSPTHHGIYDLAWLGACPNLCVFTPTDTYRSVRILQRSLEVPRLPVAILMPYGDAYEASRSLPTNETNVRIFVAGDPRVAAEASEAIPGSDVFTVEGIDSEYLFWAAMSTAKHVVVWEERVPSGGLHQKLCEVMIREGISRPTLRIGLPNTFIPPGSQEELHRTFEIDAKSTAKRVNQWLESLSQTAK